MLYKVVPTLDSVDEILKCHIQMKATKQYFPVVLFIMLYTMVLNFESVDLNKSYLGVLSYWTLTSSVLNILKSILMFRFNS